MDISTVIAREIGSNERILWSGMPKQGIIFNLFDIFLIPFSMVWCGFAVFWEFIAIKYDAPLFFALWGIPFVVMGFYIVAGRFIADSKERARTFYGITEDRIIFISTLSPKTVKSFNINEITDITLIEHPDRKGTIIFGAVPPFYSFFASTSWPGTEQQTIPNFQAVDNARTAYDLINHIRSKKEEIDRKQDQA